VACGFHAGDPEIMAATFTQARERGVAVGAHPGFPDLWGFGRRHIPFSTDEIERLVAYQIGAAQALAAYAGHRLTYVKAHGALGNLTQTDAGVARAVTRAIRAVDPALICLTIALGHQTRLAQEAGLTVKSEIFADRAYTDEGQLVSRKIAGSVIHDADQAAQRVLRMVESGTIETVTGTPLTTPVDSICVHSDTPNAVAIARRVRQALENARITIRAFA
jgi:5-oxoprolinase (ATP-hydrolysing) subunit A